MINCATTTRTEKISQSQRETHSGFLAQGGVALLALHISITILIFCSARAYTTAAVIAYSVILA